MAKYRVRIESLEGEVLGKEFTKGMDCNGFAIMLKNSDTDSDLAMHDVNTMDVAIMTFMHPQMLEAAIIAKGFYDAKDVRAARRGLSSLGDLISTLGEQ